MISSIWHKKLFFFLYVWSGLSDTEFHIVFFLTIFGM